MQSHAQGHNNQLQKHGVKPGGGPPRGPALSRVISDPFHVYLIWRRIVISQPPSAVKAMDTKSKPHVRT